jgi:L-alanine-DL-glutamate epimerase-like enolase superfamily enzyme
VPVPSVRLDDSSADAGRVSDGLLAIPSMPGLSLELNPDAVKKYTGGEELL